MQFDPRTHRYRDEQTGRFVPYSNVLRLVDEEQNHLAVRLKGHARLLVSGHIEVPEFQARMAQSLKESHLRMAALGGGGFKQLTNRHYGNVGAELKRQYGFLQGFGEDLAAGNLSEKQILHRASLYAASTRSSFNKAEFTSRGKQGFYAKRFLDPQSQHCAQCIALQVLTWTRLDQVTPPGVDCDCGGRCRCRLVFQKL